jgi:hypothetical protein
MPPMKRRKSRPGRPALPAGRSKTAASKTSRRKKNAKNVRATVLALLKKGAATRTQLLAAGTFSPAALNLHLRALRKEKQVKAEGRRPVRFSLARGTSLEPQIIDGEFEAAPAVANDQLGSLLPAYAAAPDLQAALDAVERRLGAKDRLAEKLMTLDRLASHLPAPVAEILNEIKADYLRHAL